MRSFILLSLCFLGVLAEEIVYSSPYAAIYYQRPQSAYNVQQSVGAHLLLPLKLQQPDQPHQKDEVAKTYPSPEDTTDNENVTTTEVPLTNGDRKEPTVEQIGSVEGRKTDGKNDNEKYTDGSEISDLNEKGIYYIYHPNGLLQKVVYATKDDVKNMAYTAQLKYQNVEPIKEPIYTYDPNTLHFQRLQV